MELERNRNGTNWTQNQLGMKTEQSEPCNPATLPRIFPNVPQDLFASGSRQIIFEVVHDRVFSVWLTSALRSGNNSEDPSNILDILDMFRKKWHACHRPDLATYSRLNCNGFTQSRCASDRGVACLDANRWSRFHGFVVSISDRAAWGLHTSSSCTQA